MSTIYLGYHFTIQPKTSLDNQLAKQTGAEILIAQLGEKPFESFVETDLGIIAYIQKDFWYENVLDDVYIMTSNEYEISYSIQEIDQVNWNEEWEKNFEPIMVDDQCHVRAPFHTRTSALYDIVIEPKMSFGTGHHETTHMMIQHLLAMDVTNLKTLDMGCGTAILAIFAEMKGAQPIDAIDIDNWCYLNSIENVARNNCQHISVYEGDVALLKNKKYDLIIANINRNILLNDINQYATCLHTNGILLLSGFYQEDIPYIDAVCLDNKLTYSTKIERNNWVALKYTKK